MGFDFVESILDEIQIMIELNLVQIRIDSDSFRSLLIYFFSLGNFEKCIKYNIFNTELCTPSMTMIK